MNAIRSTLTGSRMRYALLAAAAFAAVLVLAATWQVTDQRERSSDHGTSGGNVTTTDVVEPMRGGASEPAVAPDAAPEYAADAAIGGDARSDVAIAGSVGAGSPSSLAPPELEARIVRTGTVELVTTRAKFEDAWSDAQSIARRHGGYVIEASRSGAGDGPRSGTITMRVPAARFDAAVDAMRDTAGTKVEALDIASQDVTQEFVDVRSRLRHDRAVERRLLALLAETEGVSEVLAVQARLDGVQEQIELSKGRLDYLDRLTTMSTLTASLSAPAASSNGDDDEPSALGEAFGDARERFTENVAGAVVWVGGALPALVLLALAALAGRIAWRRHRRSDAGSATT